MEDFGFVSILEELVGDEDTQRMLDAEEKEEKDAEEDIMGEPNGLADSDAIDLVAGLNDPENPDYIDIYAL